jgi:thiol-disulfide isomerase/thioredoxin
LETGFPSATPTATTTKKAVSSSPKPLTTAERLAKKARTLEPAKEISTPDGFINTPSTGSTGSPLASPVTLKELIGKKVILVDFWTYSCINCQRTQPYLNAWYDKYKDQGLEIVGIHTPEFEFEKEYENVARATAQANIKYPVVLDNDYSTWTAYENRYWPRKYLIDIDGYIIYDHIGEGAYEETEKKIQTVLAERATVLGEKMNTGTTLVSSSVQADVGASASPETYFGSSRNQNLGNGIQGVSGEQTLALPKPQDVAGRSVEDGFSPTPNTLYLSGTWNLTPEYAENKTSGAKMVFRYRAKDVYMVASADNPVTVRVLRDGVQVDSLTAGDDVTNGTVTISDERLYKIIHEDLGAGEHTLELIIESPGLKAFTFTFG